jgi:Tol biopolymer transport system component
LIPERPGGEQFPALLTGDFDEPRVSPSGDRIALIDQADGERSLAILNLVSGVLRPVTASGSVRSVAWSPDGKELLVNRDYVFEIWSAGTGGLLRTLDTRAAGNLDWSPDGRRIVYVDALNQGTLRLLDLETGVDTLFEARRATQPRFSPDGKNIAYAVSDAVGLQVYIASVDGSQSARISIEVDLHRKPMWSQTSSTLFVEGANRGIHSIYRVPMDASGLVQMGPGEVVHEPWMFIDEWDLGPDDTMYLVGQPLTDDGFAGSTVLDVTVNWFEQLKRLAPPSQ